MMTQTASVVPIFDEIYLSDIATPTLMVSRVNSESVQPPSETVAIQATLHNATGRDVEVELILEGSYDSKAWEETTLTLRFASPIVVPSQGSTSVAIDYGYVRLRATVESTENAGKALLSAVLVFTHQEN